MTVFRLSASSYSGALLTIGTQVEARRGQPNAGSVGTIRAIREETGEVFVHWSSGHFDWRQSRKLDRVGKAVRGPR